MLLNDDENDICAICLENIDLEKNDSISSCSCKNKLHIECLIKWIEYKDSIYCEICRSQYNIPHHVLLQYYNQQLLNIENQQSSNINNPDSNDYYLNTYNNSNEILMLKMMIQNFQMIIMMLNPQIIIEIEDYIMKLLIYIEEEIVF